MFDRIRSKLGFARTKPQAATGLPAQTPPKPPSGRGGRAVPSFFTTATPDQSQILPRTDRRLASTDLLTYRTGSDSRQVIRDYCTASPEMSSAVWGMLRIGIPSRYTAVAISAVDGSIDVEATRLLQQIVQRVDVLPQFDEGYVPTGGLAAISQALTKDLLFTGSMCAELVLDKSRLPTFIQPFSAVTVEFKPDLSGGTKGVRPIQRVGSDEIDLDIPTIAILSLDQDLTQAYSSSPMESSIKAVLFKEEFMQDIHRIIKRVIHPRQKVRINEEKFRKYMSAEAQIDEDKAIEEMNALVADLESKVNGLAPDEALVYFDTIGFEVENPSNAGLANEYEVLEAMANSRLVTGSKAMGTVLGFQSGSSNIASTETMLFVKAVSSAVKDTLDAMYSRLFTTALRLFGLDVVAQFRYAEIDLRPATELEAFKQTEQMRILELLSLGMMTDEEACLRLTGKLPPPGYVPLSGTGFKANTVPAAIQNPSNSGSTLNQNLNPETPTQGRGQNRKAEILPISGAVK